MPCCKPGRNFLLLHTSIRIYLQKSSLISKLHLKSGGQKTGVALPTVYSLISSHLNSQKIPFSLQDCGSHLTIDELTFGSIHFSAITTHPASSLTFDQMPSAMKFYLYFQDCWLGFFPVLVWVESMRHNREDIFFPSFAARTHESPDTARPSA